MTPSDAMSRVFRIIDASMNRIGEGLRLLEDVARLLMDNAGLTTQLKAMRHDLLRAEGPFHKQLLESRDAAADVGVDIEVSGEDRQRDLPTTVVANARRVQESLRTLEELAKLPEVASLLDSEKFKHARFQLYTIERELFARLLRQDKTERICGLYVIVDTTSLAGRGHVEVARQAISGGASIIQLRDKTTPKSELLSLARELVALCRTNNVLFIMNDYLDLAIAANVDGLHIGQGDLPCAEARKLLPIDMILGCSATSVEKAVAAEADGADYIAVGSMYPTPSKETAVVVGTEVLSQVKQTTSRPLVAIGGITRDNATEVIAAGADAVAVIRAVVGAEFPGEAARQIVAEFEVRDD
ncbi:MAG: thiamine phosphate synthase [Dehalococcoidales bacterium]|nr:MAG: thiamine phosphate synthase [Dehalococcoidales bacterium]